jgi:two-component system alkaline phosphatase synthesis response regulator PhoP
MNVEEVKQMENKKILVVDDEEHMLRFMEYNLKSQGYEVELAHNGLEALERAAKSPPDLILLDIKMPVMNGYEACLQLKRNPATSRIPVIIVSVMADGEEALALNVKSYMSKPFDSEKLLEEVKRVLSEQ